MGSGHAAGRAQAARVWAAREGENVFSLVSHCTRAALLPTNNRLHLRRTASTEEIQKKEETSLEGRAGAASSLLKDD